VRLVGGSGGTGLAGFGQVEAELPELVGEKAVGRWLNTVAISFRMI
jgi:hypothetical protein